MPRELYYDAMEAKREKLEEMRRDIIEEQEMRDNLGYALERLNAYSITKDIEALQSKLSLLGHELSTKELVEQLI